MVTNTPDVPTEATADVALLCMLGAARRAFEAQRDLRAGLWERWSPTGYLGMELHGRTVGIVGLGRIGRAFARRVRGIGMTVRYHNRRRLPPELEEGAIWHETLEDMLPHCHVLSLHCPGTPENHHLLNAERIALLPQGAIVVNTARGNVVDEEALMAALESGHVFAVGLDVFENEPNVNRRWFGHSRAFLLPHIGSATVETRNAMGFRCIENLEAFFSGREPPHRVV
ncbi:Glycerate dehydrogenase [bacterium HR39]|nr:Glycerate dehydrogenase [bacterium HR39]